MTSILEIDPKCRWNVKSILNDSWVKSIDTCTPHEPGACHVHHLSVIDLEIQTNRGNLVEMTSEPPGVFAEKEKRKRKQCKPM
jgi:hypothetical protein